MNSILIENTLNLYVDSFVPKEYCNYYIKEDKIPDKDYVYVS